MSGPHRRGNSIRSHSDYRAYSRSQRIIGPSAGRVPPAWRYQRPRASHVMHESELVNLGGGYARLPQQEGSKIYISHLPPDVDDLDINQLLTETIGPVIYAFVVYDARGMTKMSAVASFLDPAHAAKAVELYNGKVIDGKEPIRVEQIGMNPKLRTGPSISPKDNNLPVGHGAKSLIDRVTQAPKTTASLLNRVSGRTGPPASANTRNLPDRIQPAQINGTNGSTTTSHPPPKPKRVKKGPKRLQKLTQHAQHATRQQQIQQLEQDMDRYRNSAPTGLGLRA